MRNASWNIKSRHRIKFPTPPILRSNTPPQVSAICQIPVSPGKGEGQMPGICPGREGCTSSNWSVHNRDGVVIEPRMHQLPINEENSTKNLSLPSRSPIPLWFQSLIMFFTQHIPVASKSHITSCISQLLGGLLSVAEWCHVVVIVAVFFSSNFTSPKAFSHLGRFYHDVQVGGDVIGRPTEKVEAFNLQTEKWESFPAMTTKRRRCAVVGIGDKLLVAGGLTSGDYSLDSVEMFDLRNRKWLELPSMPCTRFGCGFCAVDTRLFLSGGNEKLKMKSYSNRLDSFDLQSESWETWPGMVHRRNNPLAVSVTL